MRNPAKQNKIPLRQLHAILLVRRFYSYYFLILKYLRAIPIISTSPSYIDTGLVRGTQRIATFTITNTGIETLKNARLEGPSTTWMALSCPPVRKAFSVDF